MVKLFVVEWSQDWGEPIAVHKWKDWIKRGIAERNWFTETIEARDELDAYMKAGKERTNEH